jgi:hypothetical protein
MLSEIEMMQTNPKTLLNKKQLHVVGWDGGNGYLLRIRGNTNRGAILNIRTKKLYFDYLHTLETMSTWDEEHCIRKEHVLSL